MKLATALVAALLVGAMPAKDADGTTRMVATGTILQVIFFVIGLYVMFRFIQAARKIEPFTD